jgi:hypothetical protein
MTEAEFQARFREYVRGGALISEAVERAREEYHRAPTEKVCLICGARFQRRPNCGLFAWLRQATCSCACGARWRWQQRQAAA